MFRNLFLISLIISIICYASEKESRLTIHFFGSSMCGECNEIKESILFPLEKKYPEKLNLQIHDIENQEDFSLLLKFEQYYNITENSAQTLIFPDTFMTGFEYIMAEGEEIIEAYLNNPKKWKNVSLKDMHLDSNVNNSDWKERYTEKKTTPFEYIRDIGYFIISIIILLYRKNRYAVQLAQIILGLVFIFAALNKIFDPHELILIIKSYKIVPDVIASISGYLLPWLELLIALSLLLGIIPRLGALGIILFHFMFIPAITYRMINEAGRTSASIFQVSFDCGCGLGENLAWILIIRDIGYVIMGFIVLHAADVWDFFSFIKLKKL